MTKAERFRSVLHGKQPDRVPWNLYPSYLIFGDAELSLRNRYLGLFCPTAVHTMKLPGIEVVDTFKANDDRGIKTVTRTYYTEKGELSGELQFKYIRRNHSMFADTTLAQPGLVPGEGIYTSKHFFKDEKDYEILEHIITSTIYESNYNDFILREKHLGSEGLAVAAVWKTPFQELLYEWMGPETCYVELYQNPDRFRKLFHLMCEKQKELFAIIAGSPAQEAWIGSNLSAVVTPPPLFEEFCLPYYNEIADLLHENNTLLGCHFDGLLKGLEELIAQTRLDYIDAFTPPPIGDITIAEARRLWPEKTILCNFPCSLFSQSTDQIKHTVEEYLRQASPGNKFGFVITENFPLNNWMESFEAITETLEQYGKYA